MIACSKLGMHFVACTTKKYFPNQELVDLCKTYAEASGGSVTLTEDVQTGTKDADVIYTDVWVSMGEPDEVWEERIKDLTLSLIHIWKLLITSEENMAMTVSFRSLRLVHWQREALSGMSDV